MIRRVRSFTWASTVSASKEKPFSSRSSIGTAFAPENSITDS